MHHAKNSDPEWGYLAPAPNFFRAARIVLAATAVGATAGAGVVLSLVDRSVGQTPVEARMLVRPIQAAPTPDSAASDRSDERTSLNPKSTHESFRDQRPDRKRRRKRTECRRVGTSVEHRQFG